MIVALRFERGTIKECVKKGAVFYKERLSLSQSVGLGLDAIVLLNL